MENLIQSLRETKGLASLVGIAPAFVKAIANLSAVAKGGATVLISGETGTGKELVARAMHYLSEKAPFPFVPVNCGSLPDTLLEDELFGHARGAFTDAHLSRPGLVARAEKGTLFLDEVDTLTPKAQVALLRLLQDKTFRPIGSDFEQHADVRVVAATNSALDQLVQAGNFRCDLYYRICVFSINLPSLRDRKEDILLLAAHFLEKHTPAQEVRRKLSPAASSALLSFDWPGNIRELENAMIRGIHLSRGDFIETQDIGIPSAAPQHTNIAPTAPAKLHGFKAMKQELIDEFERDYLARLMYEHRGNVTLAARTAGKERRDLGKLLKKHRLDPKFFQSAVPGTSP